MNFNIASIGWRFHTMNGVSQTYQHTFMLEPMGTGTSPELCANSALIADQGTISDVLRIYPINEIVDTSNSFIANMVIKY